MVKSIDWKWLIIGLLIGVFGVPFIQAKLGGAAGPISKNKA